MKEIVLFAVYDIQIGKVLSVQYPETHEKFPGQNMFPTGTLEEGETIDQAFNRELSEEFNIEPINRFKLGRPIRIENGTRVFHPFLITEWEGSIPKTILDTGYPIVWETLDEVSDSSNTTRPIVVERIRHHLSIAA